jgi:hypothetical protein
VTFMKHFEGGSNYKSLGICVLYIVRRFKFVYKKINVWCLETRILMVNCNFLELLQNFINVFIFLSLDPTTQTQTLFFSTFVKASMYLKETPVLCKCTKCNGTM